MPRNDGDPDRPIQGLEQLYSSRPPSDALEARVLDRLRGEGWLGRRRQSVWPRRALALAAGVIVFAAGWMVGREAATPSATEGAYMLILWEGPDPGGAATGGPIASEYAEWARSLDQSGVVVDGNELGAERELVGDPRGIRAGGEVGAPRIGGYFLVGAADLAAARAIAATHPHIGYGGWIEVAEVVH